MKEKWKIGINRNKLIMKGKWEIGINRNKDMKELNKIKVKKRSRFDFHSKRSISINNNLAFMKITCLFSKIYQIQSHLFLTAHSGGL